MAWGRGMRSETKSKKEEGRSTLELCQNFQTSKIMNPNKEAREVEEKGGGGGVWGITRAFLGVAAVSRISHYRVVPGGTRSP